MRNESHSNLESSRPPAIADVARSRRRPAEKGEYVQSLARALSLINQLAAASEGTSLTELAHQVGLSSSTAHRLLTTLEQERYVQFDAERRLWRIGVQAFVVGNVFLRTRRLVSAVRLRMQALMEESGETVNLAIEDEGEAVYLAQIECPEMMRAFARPGAKVGLHCSAVGKALLSTMPDSRVGKILQRRGMVQLTAKTILTTADLKADLDLARAHGFAVDDEEHAVGLRCIAAVILGERSEPLAAISVSGPVARIGDARLEELGRSVRQAAESIASDLRAQEPDRV